MSSNAKFQLLTGYVNLAGNRNSVSFRGTDNPMTLAETMVLSTIHGGSENVHGLIDCGERESTMDAEYERLSLQYGGVVQHVFPKVAGNVTLSIRDERLPTEEEVAAGELAREDARQNVRASKRKPEKADKAGVQSLADMSK